MEKIENRNPLKSPLFHIIHEVKELSLKLKKDFS